MNLQDQLIRDEGMKLYPYRDTVGKITIGVGRNLTDDGISEQEALDLLQDDIIRTKNRVLSQWPWVKDLSDARAGVIFNMAFNMGVDGLAQFVHFLGAMQDRDWNAAALEMKNSAWATEVGSRATRLIQQVQSDTWV